VLLDHLRQVQHILVLLNQLSHGWRMVIIISVDTGHILLLEQLVNHLLSHVSAFLFLKMLWRCLTYVRCIFISCISPLYKGFCAYLLTPVPVYIWA
jgi:hypothetical protein